MKKNLVAGFGLLVVLMMGAGTTYLSLKKLAPRMGENRGAGFASLHEWTHQLGLSEEQKKQIEPMEVVFKKDWQTVQSKLADERMALCRILQTAPKESPELDSYADRVSALEAEQQKLVLRHLIAMRELLTDQQRQRFFSSMMHEICENCRRMVPGKPCVCGVCCSKDGSHTRPS